MAVVFRSVWVVFVCAEMCGLASAGEPRIELSSESVMHDEVVEIAVTGLEPWARVTLRLAAKISGIDFVSTADFHADAKGRIEVASQAPVAGSYQGADAMGLFWSMEAKENDRESPDHPEQNILEIPPPQRYELTVLIGGDYVARAFLERIIVPDGVRVRPLTEERLRGVLYLPPGDGPHPAMLVLTGSGGGYSLEKAAALTSRGYAALALAYFNAPDLPEQLVAIPLEYFGQGLEWLAGVPEVDGDRIGVIGGSRGGELSLLLGSFFPQIRVVVAQVPSHVVWEGCCDEASAMKSSWTWQGKPVSTMPPTELPLRAQQYWFDIRGSALAMFWLSLGDSPGVEAATIPVERIGGPVLLISGGDDQMWPSTYMADRVVERLKDHEFPHPYLHLRYDDAGHAVGLTPYWPTARWVNYFDSSTKEYLALGGTAETLARCAEDAWQRTVEFLDVYLR